MKAVLFTKVSYWNKYVYKYIIHTFLMFSTVGESSDCFPLSLGKNTCANVEHINLVKFLMYLCSLSKDNWLFSEDLCLKQ